MALTRKLLKELGIADENAEAIIKAHADTVEGLKGERDEARAAAQTLKDAARDREELAAEIDRLKSAQEEPARIRAEFDAYKARVEEEKADGIKRAAVRAALDKAGANRRVAELLRDVDLQKVEMDGDALKDAQSVLSPLREKWGDFFAVPARHPVPAITPPVSGKAPLSVEDVRRMSDEEINRNWSAVRMALRKGE